MRALAALAAFAVVVALDAGRADACHPSANPSAQVIGASPQATGVRPWFRLYRGEGRVLVEVDAACAPRTACGGRRIALVGDDHHARPAKPLKAGARYQLVVPLTRKMSKVVADFVVASGEAPALAAWEGLTVTSAAIEPAGGPGLCTFKGLVLLAAITNGSVHRAGLAGHVLLVYAKKPSPAAPHRGLVRIVPLDAATDEVVLFRNVSGQAWIEPKPPKSVWIMLADGNGHLGAPIELTLP